MWKWLARQYRESSTKERFKEDPPEKSAEEIESEKVSDLLWKIRNDIKKINQDSLWIHLSQLSQVFRIRVEETVEKHNQRIAKLLECLQWNDEEGFWERPLQERDYYRNTEGVIIDTKDTSQLNMPSIKLIMDKPFSHGEIQVSQFCRKESENEREALLLRIYGIELWKIPRILNGTMR